jgi:hypothetical protein
MRLYARISLVFVIALIANTSYAQQRVISAKHEPTRNIDNQMVAEDGIGVRPCISH